MCYIRRPSSLLCWKHQHTNMKLCLVGDGWKDEACWFSSFNSPNDQLSSPAAPVLGPDQRIESASFEGIKEKTPAGE